MDSQNEVCRYNADSNSEQFMLIQMVVIGKLIRCTFQSAIINTKDGLEVVNPDLCLTQLWHGYCPRFGKKIPDTISEINLSENPKDL
jgi:hypothetical protein